MIHRIRSYWPWLVGGWYGKNGKEPLIFSADLALIVTLGGKLLLFFSNLFIISILFYVYNSWITIAYNIFM